MFATFREHHLFQILRRFDHQHLPLDLFLSNYFRSHTALGSHDRKTIAETIFGMTRWRSLLDHIVGKENSWEERYAIYKGFQPHQYLYVNHIPLHTRVSFPKELFDLIFSQYGEEKAIELCQINNTAAPLTIRINPLKTTRDQLLTAFSSRYEVVPCEFSPFGIQFKQRVALTQTEEFKAGLFEIQDEASQLVADKIEPKPGDQVLDYCAGSGGKTLGFAHKMENQGQIYLHDVREMSLEQAKKRLARAGIHNAQTLSSTHGVLEKLKKKMDWVLVDAPCSGTGTLRRNPDMKWKFSLEMLKRLKAEQRVIFERALSFVKTGGYITYATCSILKEENEVQLDHFLKTYDLEIVGLPFVSLPSYNGMDGFFAVTCLKQS